MLRHCLAALSLRPYGRALHSLAPIQRTAIPVLTHQPALPLSLPQSSPSPSPSPLSGLRRCKHTAAACIFCKIAANTLPSAKVYESSRVLAFLDIQPLSKGHVLVIPKEHAVTMEQVSDEALAEILPLVKKIAKAAGLAQYNILQNNGALAHQAVGHVHFHIIPKPDEKQGLHIQWTPLSFSPRELEQHANELRSKLGV